MLLPFVGHGQEPLQQFRHYAAHTWVENPSQPNQFKLSDVYISQDFQNWDGTPFDFFTVSACQKFSLRWLYNPLEANEVGYGSNHPVKWQFFRTDGTLYGEYLEPEVNIIGEWESYYGNTSSYNSGITPDFFITEPGTYYLYCMDFIDGVWVPNEPENSNSIIVHVLPTDDNATYTINAPDNICYGEFLCWSINPPVDPSRIISSNWTYLANPCELASPVGPNNITVSLRKFCSDEIVTITKPINIVNFQDFELPVGVCPNQIFNVGNITLCNSATPIVSCAWNWGDGTTSNTRYVSHSYSTPGTYTIQLSLTVNYFGTIQTSTISKTIQVYSLPSAPLLSGTFNTCTNPGTFTITNPEANTTYNWSASYSSVMSGTNTTQDITWNTGTFPDAPNYGIIRVRAISNGCIDSTDYKVWKCCTNGTSPTFSNVTVSDFPAGIVYINGTVTVNSNITETETTFKMGPEAKIVINAPNTFTATGKTNFSAGCAYMWDGIYVNGTTSKIVMNVINPIRGAMNAINSTNGGNFEVKNSYFTDNYIAIKVTDYRPSTAINHPGIVYGTTFKNENNMIAPYAGQKSYTGIYIDNVYNLTIGNVAYTPNVFNNVFCGIQSYNSYMTVAKNTFQNIQKTPMCSSGEVTDYSVLYCETGIHVAKKGNDILNGLIPTVTIGGANTTDENVFTNCDLAYNSYLTKQTIRNNSVSTTKTGFSCRDAYHGSLISNNNLTGVNTNIYINSTIPSIRAITIENNTLNNVGTYGIMIVNCKSIGLAKTKILNNKMYFTGPKVSRGIYAVNCDAITLQGNEFTNSGALVTTNALSKFMRGINIENCPNSLVKSNKFTKMGSGVYAEGMESGTQFQCNELSQNYFGFYFPNGLTVGTVYENQGTAANPNDNKWISDHPYTTAYRISGDASSSIPPKYWYYKSNAYFNPNVVSGTPAFSFVLATPSGSAALAPCDGAKGGDDELYTESIDSSSTMEEAIPENSNLAPQMRYLYMSMLFNSNAEQFATEMTQDEQSLYQNIPLISKINELSQNDSTINKAIELNNAFAPINDMEIHRKFVNEVYLNYVVKGETPSSSLVEGLYDIANLSPSMGGEAVHIARAILNYQPTTRNIQDFDLPAKLSLNDNIQWYPNPANDILNIASLETFVTGSKIELYDITGRMVLSSSIGSESNIAAISLKEVKQGLYLCVIKNGEEVLSSSKISVIKQ